MTILSVFILLSWEISLFYLSIFITHLKIKKITTSNVLTCLGAITGVKLLLGAAIPQWMAFFGLVSSMSFLGTSIFITLSVKVIAKRSQHFDETCKSLFESIKKVLHAKFLPLTCLLASIAPAIGSAFGVIVEADSIINSNSIISIMKGNLSPLEYPWNYSMLWESSYLPSIQLLNSTIFIGVINLQNLAFLLFGIKSLLNELAISKLNANLILIGTSLSGLVWGYTPNGISTLKNDLILGTTTLWLVAISIRYMSSRQILHLHKIILIVSCCFILSKFSGVFILVFFFGLLALLRRKTFFQIDLRYSLFLILAILLTNGVYYLANFVEHRNPIFPFNFKIGKFSLPGEIDTSGTRLIDQLDQVKTYEYFFQLNNLFNSRIGTLFLLNFLICLLYILNKSFKKKSNISNLDIYLATLFLGLWFMFLITPWSSGIASEPFFYLEQGYSYRYAIAAVMLTVILSTYATERISKGFLKISILINFLIVLLSIEYLYATPWVGISRYIDLELVFLSVCLIAFLPGMLLYVFKSSINLRLALVFYGLVLIPSLQFFEDSGTSKFGWELEALENFPSSSAQVFLGTWGPDLPKLDGLLMPNAYSVIKEVGAARYGGLQNFTSEVSEIKPLVKQSGVLFTSYPSSNFTERDYQTITSYMFEAGYNMVQFRPYSIAFFRKDGSRPCEASKEWCPAPEQR
jgi:hypothetical protein